MITFLIIFAAVFMLFIAAALYACIVISDKKQEENLDNSS